MEHIMNPLVGVIMGSISDFETMKNTIYVLEDFGIPYEKRVISAHRTPNLLFEYASIAEERGLEILICAAGGAAHLPGMTASKTNLPVLGVPICSTVFQGMDSFFSISQMPKGVPVGTLAIGSAGAYNAALLAIKMLANKYSNFKEKLNQLREQQIKEVENMNNQINT
jgi:5-(carboxyamino)imidazole ribonucleotide mutase